MEKYYRLPSGATVTNQNTYLEAWHNIIDPFEKLLEIRVVGFDPDIVYIDKKSPHSWNHSSTIPVYLVRRILEEAVKVKRKKTAKVKK